MYSLIYKMRWLTIFFLLQAVFGWDQNATAAIKPWYRIPEEKEIAVWLGGAPDWEDIEWEDVDL